MAAAANTYVSPEDRAEFGRALRKRVPRSAHAAWSPPADRDPIGLITRQEANRLPWLVPERRRRMAPSAFAFFRGAAVVMATDLAPTPSTGITVQACGDAHIANFGVFASPERRLVFDCNDFDETLRGPWEWDVKRLAASCRIAAEVRRFDAARCDAITRVAVTAYRQTMHDFASRRVLDAWYGEPSSEQWHEIEHALERTSTRQTVERVEARARRRDHLRAFDKLVEVRNGSARIRNDAPRLVPLRDLLTEQSPAELEASALGAFDAYKSSLLPERRVLLDRFRPLDLALKVVGVGSVGTRCFVMLLEGRDDLDPLFLQFKEANASVLEDPLGTRGPGHHGRRVVEGQRLMQTTSDIFLGWSRDAAGCHYYGRQLQDWKGSIDVNTVEPADMERYVRLCGWALARAHARSGMAIEIAAYLGTGNAFDVALAQFAIAYAAQNAADHAQLVASGAAAAAS